MGFYNEQKLHEELGDLPPAEYEEIELQDRQHPNSANHLSEPLGNQGASVPPSASAVADGGELLGQAAAEGRHECEEA
jgi:hypothetical protein